MAYVENRESERAYKRGQTSPVVWRSKVGRGNSCSNYSAAMATWQYFPSELVGIRYIQNTHGKRYSSVCRSKIHIESDKH